MGIIKVPENAEKCWNVLWVCHMYGYHKWLPRTQKKTYDLGVHFASVNDCRGIVNSRLHGQWLIPTRHATIKNYNYLYTQCVTYADNLAYITSIVVYIYIYIHKYIYIFSFMTAMFKTLFQHFQPPDHACLVSPELQPPWMETMLSGVLINQ